MYAPCDLFTYRNASLTAHDEVPSKGVKHLRLEVVALSLYCLVVN